MGVRNNEVARAAPQRSMDDTGAVVMGRRLFDIIDDPRGWSDDMGYGADLAGRPPFFVVTHFAPMQVRLGLDFTFGAAIGAAIDQARAAATDKAVIVMGGGHVIAQCLEAGLVDELRLHIAPIVLGAGSPLFDEVGPRELVQRSGRGVGLRHAPHLQGGAVAQPRFDRSPETYLEGPGWLGTNDIVPVCNGS